MEQTYYWHDYETFGVDPVRDRPVQFAGLRTDREFNPIGEPLVIYSALSNDYLPDPNACLITGINPQESLQKGLVEAEFMRAIESELSVPGTCALGYNSLRFDDHVTRHSLYRNFFSPYTREWQGGNSRWDIIDLARATYALKPEGIEWPLDETGVCSFRLENLTKANGIAHEQAHDALSDVYATCALAKLIRQKQPKLFRYFFQLRSKREVAKLLDLNSPKVLLHISGMIKADRLHTTLVIPIAKHPSNPNGVVVYDLSQDPKNLLDGSIDQLREALFSPAEALKDPSLRPALKTVHLNRCPALVPTSILHVDPDLQKRLSLDLNQSKSYYEKLLSCKNLQHKVQAIVQPKESDALFDADLQLYTGAFFSDQDNRLMAKVRNTPAHLLSDLDLPFSDPRLPELFLHYRARNYPQSLTEPEQKLWQGYRLAKLKQGKDGHRSFEAFFTCINTLKIKAELNPKEQTLLADLERYGKQMEKDLG